MVLLKRKVFSGVNMNEGKKGYYIYSTFVVLFFILLFGFTIFLIYKLIIQFATGEITNELAIQSFATLIVTVFIGSWFAELLKRKSAKSIETYKIQSNIAINIVDYAGKIIFSKEETRNDYIQKYYIEMQKARLFFNDIVLNNLERFYAEKSDEAYHKIVKSLQAYFK